MNSYSNGKYVICELKMSLSLNFCHSILTKHNDEGHLDRLDFRLGDESSGAGSPAVIIAVQGDFPPPGLGEGN